jgi:hypothetical protein
VDTGDPIVVLAGLHPVAMNCLEPIGLFRSMILRGSA